MSPAEKPGFNDNKTIYRVGDKDFPVQPATNGTTKYVPVEALEATLKLFPEQDPFSDYDQLKIAGREFTAITDPTDGQTYVHLDAVVAAQEELQSQLNAIQNKPFIEDARKGDLVYVNTGDEFVIGVVRDNMPDKVILDRAYVVHSADYHERKQDMNKKFWKASRDSEVLDELAGCGITQRMGIPQMQGSQDSLWRILNAYTAVCTHSVGGWNGSNLSNMTTDYMIARAMVTAKA